MQITELTPLHNGSSGHLREALHRLPEYVPLTEALARCDSAARRRRATIDSPPLTAVTEDVRDRLAAGEDVPADLDEQAHAAATAVAQAQAAIEVLLKVEERLTGERDRVVRDGADAVCRDFDEQLREIVTEARGLELAGATDADEAITRGAADAWAELARLRGAYFQLRGAQRVVMERLTRAVQHFDTFGWVENFAELHPRWYDAGRPMPSRSLIDGGPAVVAREPEQVAPWPEDPAGRFLWLVQHAEARPWVPTRRQLEQAHTAAVEARHAAEAAEQEPVDPAVIRRQEQRLAHYQQRLAAGV